MSTLSKNIFYNLFGQIILLLLTFISIKYIFGQLGKDVLGIIYFTASITTVLANVMELGISRTTVREVAINNKKSPDYVKDLIQTGSFFYWGIFIFFVVVWYFLSPILVHKWINLNSVDNELAIHCFRILGIASLLVFPKILYDAMLRGIQRMEYTNIISIGVTILQHTGTILIIVYDGTIIKTIYWLALCHIITVIAYLFAATRFFPLKAFIPIYRKYVVEKNKNFSSALLLSTIFAAIHTNANKIIISKLLPISHVGYFGLASNLAAKANRIVNVVSKAAFPHLSEAYSENKENEILGQYNKLQDTVCYFLVPILALIPFFAIPLFTEILNEEVAEMLFLPTVLLVIGSYLGGTLLIPHALTLALGKPKIFTMQAFYAVLIIVPYSYIAIDKWGLLGAGTVPIVHKVFAYLYGVPRVCRNCLNINPLKWYANVVKILMLVIVTYGFFWFLQYKYGNYSIITLCISYLSGTLFFATGAYILIGIEIKTTINSYLRMLFRRI